MKTIRTYSNLSDAGFASSLLEAAGIKTLLADEQSFTIGYGLERVMHFGLKIKLYIIITTKQYAWDAT